MVKPSLAHDATDDAFAEAMCQCQGYPPSCSDAGECLSDGVCFSSSGAGFKAAHRTISDLIESEGNIFVRSWLKVALDALDHERFMERDCRDALRYMTIQKRVRRMYGEEIP